MDGVGPNEGRKRRLPLWMLGVSAADQVRNSENGDVNNNNDLEEGLASQVCPPKSKSRNTQHGKDFLLHDKELLDMKSSLLVKCETKRRKRKPSRQDEDRNGNIQETGSEEKKYDGVARTVRESAPRKRRKAKSLRFRSSEKTEISSPSEDDGELTMEDLMSIAEEYVKVDKDIEQPSSNKGSESESRLPETALSRNESGGSLNAPQSNRRLPTNETTAYNSTESLTSDRIVINLSRTGNTAQDMLDLFLGPLLKKPLEEKKTECITEDMTFAYELRKQSQNDIVGEVVPLTKKKSSLKDKVAMFLD